MRILALAVIAGAGLAFLSGCAETKETSTPPSRQPPPPMPMPRSFAPSASDPRIM